MASAPPTSLPPASGSSGKNLPASGSASRRLRVASPVAGLDRVHSDVFRAQVHDIQRHVPFSSAKFEFSFLNHKKIPKKKKIPEIVDGGDAREVTVTQELAADGFPSMNQSTRMLGSPAGLTFTSK